MKHFSLRDWEWMIRTAAQPEPPADDNFSDIWENSRSGRNPDAEQWLNSRVRYERPDSSFNPLHHTNWRGVAEEDLPRDVQHRETNRDIDEDHAAFENALYRGGRDQPDEGQFSLTGQPPEEYEPTSPERLASDEGWLLGPGKQFDFPGGRSAAGDVHNGMHQRGFELQNEGTDENPIPSYVHQQTGSRIKPIVHSDGSLGWQMSEPLGGTSEHSSQASAAASHQQAMDEQNAAEAAAWKYHNVQSDDLDPIRAEPSSRRTRQPSRRESPNYIPKTKAQQMSWGNLFDQAVHGDDGHGREFQRASVKSVHNPYRGETGRLYGVHQDQWNQDFDNDAAGRGKVAQAIYHYATPIAWKYHNVQPDGTYDEGHWRMPATSFGSGGFFSTGQVQSLLGPSLWRGSYSHTRDPLVSYPLHKKMIQDGLHQQDDQNYQGVDSFGNAHHVAPSQSGKTAVHTIISPGGDSTWTKRVPANEAADNFFLMTNDVAGQPHIQNPATYLKNQKYRGTGNAAPTPARRRDVPLRLQPELPFRNSSVASWSEFLRE